MSNPLTSSSSLSTLSTLQHRLQSLLDNQHHIWAYAIFWRVSTTDNGGHGSPVLLWGAGHLSSGGNEDDIEGFYLVSLTRSYPVGDAAAAGVPACALASSAAVWLAGACSLQSAGCQRGLEAHLHGVQTLVCIAAAGGVVELGSLELISAIDWSLYKQVKSTLVPEVVPVTVKSKTKKQKRKILESHSNHKGAEQRRRDKINKWFYELRTVVPYVSKMDKASLLADSVVYINELRARVDELEAAMKENEMTMPVVSRSNTNNPSSMEVEVRFVGEEKLVIRVNSGNVDHPPAKLMEALRDLRVRVHHLSVVTVKEMIYQHVVASINEGESLTEGIGEMNLKSALLARLE